VSSGSSLNSFEAGTRYESRGETSQEFAAEKQNYFEFFSLPFDEKMQELF